MPTRVPGNLWMYRQPLSQPSIAFRNFIIIKTEQHEME